MEVEKGRIRIIGFEVRFIYLFFHHENEANTYYDLLYISSLHISINLSFKNCFVDSQDIYLLKHDLVWFVHHHTCIDSPIYSIR